MHPPNLIQNRPCTNFVSYIWKNIEAPDCSNIILWRVCGQRYRNNPSVTDIWEVCHCSRNFINLRYPLLILKEKKTRKLFPYTALSWRLAAWRSWRMTPPYHCFLSCLSGKKEAEAEQLPLTCTGAGTEPKLYQCWYSYRVATPALARAPICYYSY